MDLRLPGVLRRPADGSAPAPRPVAVTDGERRTPAPGPGRSERACPAEVEARLAVLLRWM